MGVPASEVGYTPAMPRREDHEVHKGHVVALEKIYIVIYFVCLRCIYHTAVGIQVLTALKTNPADSMLLLFFPPLLFHNKNYSGKMKKDC